MSYTKRQFINDAFAEIGIANYEFDIQPEESQLALRNLDRMMAEWASEGINCRYPLPDSPSQSDLDEVTNVFDAANSAIVINLALRIGFYTWKNTFKRNQS